MQRKKPKRKTKTNFYCCGRLKRYVLRLDLNSFKDDVWRIINDMGRLFQSFGPTCENVHSPQVVTYFVVTARSCEVAPAYFDDAILDI